MYISLCSSDYVIKIERNQIELNWKSAVSFFLCLSVETKIIIWRSKKQVIATFSIKQQSKQANEKKKMMTKEKKRPSYRLLTRSIDRTYN